MVDEFDAEDESFLLIWESGVDRFDDDDDEVFVVVVVVAVVDDNGILDGTGFFNEIEVNDDDGLTSEPIQITEKRTTCSDTSFFSINY